MRDWLYVSRSLPCAGQTCVLAAGRPGETYNVGGGNEARNIDVVKGICALLDRLRPRTDRRSYAEQITFVKDRPGHDRRYAINAGKLEAELGWKALESFDTGLEKTVQWNLDNARWIEQVTSGDYRQWVEKQYA